MLASQRIEWVVLGNWFWAVDPSVAQNQSSVEIEVPTMNQKRGATPSAIEWMILAWVSGKLFCCKRLHIPCRIFFRFFLFRFDME